MPDVTVTLTPVDQTNLAVALAIALTEDQLTDDEVNALVAKVSPGSVADERN